MPTDVESLIEMGFSDVRARRALMKTGYKGVNVAMDWLFDHGDDPDIDDPLPEPKGNVLGADSAGGETAAAEGEDQNAEDPNLVAQSLKCDECGKQLRSADDAQMHAARTGHSQFSESSDEVKPLSEEERKAQMEALQDKLQKKRLDRLKQEKEEAILKEKKRREEGKNIGTMKEDFERQEMKRIAAERKKEKDAEKKYKEELRAKIEQDRKERLERSSGGATTSAPPAPVAAPAPVVVKKVEHDKCRLQIRLPKGGQPLTETFGAKEPLSAVRLYVQQKWADAPPSSSQFTFMTNFPKRIFTEEEMEAPLNCLDLCPSSALLVKLL